MFKNREETGELLAEKLAAWRDDPHALLLALPRGGVVVGYRMSLALHLPLDVVITRKIGAPGNPEYAVGAISERGTLYWNRGALSGLSLTERDLDAMVREQRKEIARRVALYRQGKPFPQLQDRTVIVVDDGLATGATFFASVATVREGRPRRVIAAGPVGPRSTVEQVRAIVDELIVLRVPEPFYAVGNFYEQFEQVEDREVLQYLNLAEETYLATRSAIRSQPSAAEAGAERERAR